MDAPLRKASGALNLMDWGETIMSAAQKENPASLRKRGRVRAIGL
jgi:hypothetical protein